MRTRTLKLAVVAAASYLVAGTASRGSTAPQRVYFVRDVMPILTSRGCNAAPCHGSAAGGGGGLQLAMFGADPNADYIALTRAGRGRYVNLLEPAKSLLLAKPAGNIAHAGGKRLALDSPQYKTLLSWVVQGARGPAPEDPKIVALELAADKLALTKGRSSQLKVTASFSDGSSTDVTADAQYDSSDRGVAAVEADGKVTATGFGQAVITATYLREHDLVRVVVPRPLDSPFPQFPPNNKIDELVAAKLKELGLAPSPLCSDSEFLRRVSLDVTGTLPGPQQAREFLADTRADKRAALIDELLDSDEFADFWALKWGDLLRVKSEYPSNLWPNAVQAYYHWIRTSIAQNKPYDRFARELITASGSNFRDPPVNFYRAFRTRTPQHLADATALIFMGARLGCASCHAHPVEQWTLEDNLGMAAFFAKLAYKQTSEWKEEIVYFRPRLSLRHPETKRTVQPRFLGGRAPRIGPDQDPRVVFADWLTAPENPWFARNIVNRIWFWLMGRGIVHQVDDLRPTNPPQNPELLDYLAKELIEHQYDLKHIYRLILNSRTYQLSSKTNESNAGDRVAFSHYLTKRLTAEQLLDAVSQITETSENYVSRVPEPYTMLPKGHRAIELFDGSIRSSFLELFGRPGRDSAYEAERDNTTSMRQALYLLNSNQFAGKINGSPRLRRLLQSQKTNAEIVEEIYLSALSRLPSEQEKQDLLTYIGQDKANRTRAVQDFVWALCNTNEFLFNH